MMLRKTAFGRRAWQLVGTASMRPQHDAAENLSHARDRRDDPGASMRPQHDAAENAAGATGASATTAGFNEAAA